MRHQNNLDNKKGSCNFKPDEGVVQLKRRTIEIFGMSFNPGKPVLTRCPSCPLTITTSNGLMSILIVGGQLQKFVKLFQQVPQV